MRVLWKAYVLFATVVFLCSIVLSRSLWYKRFDDDKYEDRQAFKALRSHAISVPEHMNNTHCVCRLARACVFPMCALDTVPYVTQGAYELFGDEVVCVTRERAISCDFRWHDLWQAGDVISKCACLTVRAITLKEGSPEPPRLSRDGFSEDFDTVQNLYYDGPAKKPGLDQFENRACMGCGPGAPVVVGFPEVFLAAAATSKVLLSAPGFLESVSPLNETHCGCSWKTNHWILVVMATAEGHDHISVSRNDNRCKDLGDSFVCDMRDENALGAGWNFTLAQCHCRYYPDFKPRQTVVVQMISVSWKGASGSRRVNNVSARSMLTYVMLMSMAVVVKLIHGALYANPSFRV